MAARECGIGVYKVDAFADDNGGLVTRDGGMFDCIGVCAG